MNKEVILGSEGRNHLVKGVNVVADAVKVTFGAKGRNVIIEDEMGNPHVTKDGVTVAKSINLKDRNENLGASMIKQAANKTVEMAGDGTSATCILVQEIIDRGVKEVDGGVDPMSIKRGMDKATDAIVKELVRLGRPIKDPETLIQIASISANNDSVIGSIIADAVSRVGEDGIINVEESQSIETTINVVDGMKVDRGYLSPYFVTNTQKMFTEFLQPHILLYDKKISRFAEITGVLEKQAPSKRPLVIIAEDIEGEALQGLIVNNMNNKISVCALKCPGFGESRVAFMEDIAILTGGVFITESKGLTLDKVELKHFGSCAKFTSYKDYSVIAGGSGSKGEIQRLTADLKSQEKIAEHQWVKDLLKDRSAKLNNSIAVIKVGGVTEIEIKEKKDRFDDALCATVSAMEEGFVTGGGSALVHASRFLSMIKTDDKDEEIGVSIIEESVLAPFKQILTNAGVNFEKHLTNIMLSDYGIGYNVKTEKVENLFESGIIDPLKVIRVSLENANSYAGIFLTTECVITTKID